MLLAKFIRIAALVAGTVASTQGTAAPALPPALSEVLGAAKMPASHAAFFVQRVDTERPLLAHNAGKRMNPASTMKLVTTYAALELLGPAHTWRTEALTEALPHEGRLTGNLYLRGSGDPSLTVERFWLLMRQLRARGIGEINGDVVIDRSAFRLPPHDPAAFDNEPLRPYNAGADALLVNFRSIAIALTTDAPNRSVQAIIGTPADGVSLHNRIAYAEGPCGDWREKLQVGIDGFKVSLAGSFSSSCGDKTLHLSPWPADTQVEQLFRALWKELGGTLSGRVREGDAPPSARLVYRHESPPLGEIVRDVNKWSNNVMARQLFLALAPSRPATPEAAHERITGWLKEKGLEGAVLENGTGLSRTERITAEGLGRLLLAAWKSPAMPELISSLPVAGTDGTLRKRLGDSAAAGRAHLKTGYIEGVRAIAGYVMDSKGQRWVVVGILNDAQMKNGSKPLDALVRWVAER